MISCSFATWAKYGRMGVFNVESGKTLDASSGAGKSNDLKAFIDGMRKSGEWSNGGTKNTPPPKGEKNDKEDTRETKPEGELTSPEVLQGLTEVSLGYPQFVRAWIPSNKKNGPAWMPISLAAGTESIHVDMGKRVKASSKPGALDLPYTREAYVKVKNTKGEAEIRKVFVDQRDLKESGVDKTAVKPEALNKSLQDKKESFWNRGGPYVHVRIPDKYSLRVMTEQGKMESIGTPEGQVDWKSIHVQLPRGIDQIKALYDEDPTHPVRIMWGNEKPGTDGKELENITYGVAPLRELIQVTINPSPASNLPGGVLGVNAQALRGADGTRISK